MTKYEIAERIRDLVAFNGDEELIGQIYALADKVERDDEPVMCDHKWKLIKSVSIDPPYENHTYRCVHCNAIHTEQINVYGM